MKTYNLSEIFNLLYKFPPETDFLKERQKLASSIDRCFSQAKSELSKEVFEFYNKIIDKTFAEIETEKVLSGFTVWKLYSSGFIIKSPDFIIAIDLTAGYPKKENFCSQLSFSKKQYEKAAELIDYSFHTHEHPDHIDIELSRALCKKNKKVFVTESNKRLFAKNALMDKLISYDDFDDIACELPFSAECFSGWQRMTEGREFDVPCYAVCVTFKNKTSFMVKGDIFDGDEYKQILESMYKKNLSPQVFLSGAYTHCGHDIIKQTKIAFDPVFLPAHEWEFSHRKEGRSGSATQTYEYFFKQFASEIVSKKAFILFWGEKIHFE